MSKEIVKSDEPEPLPHNLKKEPTSEGEKIPENLEETAEKKVSGLSVTDDPEPSLFDPSRLNLIRGKKMRVGLTYDLRDDYLARGYGEEETAEFDRLDTIEGIEESIQSLGFETERIGNLNDLMPRLMDGDKWDLVFNIAEGLYGIGREAQVPALLDAYQIPYTFSDPVVLALTLNKAMTKRVVRDFGVLTPDFAVVEKEEEIENVNLPYPLFVKPIGEGTGKGISDKSKVFTKNDLESVCKELLDQFKQPVLIETYLSGREFTVGITGTGKDAIALGVMEIVFKHKEQDEIYSYLNKKNYEELVEYRPVNDYSAQMAKEMALAAWRGLGGRDGGRIDLKADANGTPYFLEVNPLPGLNPVHSDLPILCRLHGINYSQLIGRIMESAVSRNTELVTQLMHPVLRLRKDGLRYRQPSKIVTHNWGTRKNVRWKYR